MELNIIQSTLISLATFALHRVVSEIHIVGKFLAEKCSMRINMPNSDSINSPGVIKNFVLLSVKIKILINTLGG